MNERRRIRPQVIHNHLVAVEPANRAIADFLGEPKESVWTCSVPSLLERFLIEHGESGLKSILAALTHLRKSVRAEYDYLVKEGRI